KSLSARIVPGPTAATRARAGVICDTNRTSLGFGIAIWMPISIMEKQPDCGFRALVGQPSLAAGSPGIPAWSAVARGDSNAAQSVSETPEAHEARGNS